MSAIDLDVAYPTEPVKSACVFLGCNFIFSITYTINSSSKLLETPGETPRLDAVSSSVIKRPDSKVSKRCNSENGVLGYIFENFTILI